MVMSTGLNAQIDQEEFDAAAAEGVTMAVSTTMRVEANGSRLLVSGKHELLRATLLAFIREQGLDSIQITFPKVKWPDGSESDPKVSGFTGEIENGVYRFIRSSANVAIAAEKDLERAVDQMFKSAKITVLASVNTARN